MQLNQSFIILSHTILTAFLYSVRKMPYYNRCRSMNTRSKIWKHILNLNLSAEVKAALSWTLQITKVSELEGLNYLTFANKCPKNCNALAIADELNALGYLYPPENEISVNDVPMSKRLQNVLMRNNILYLSQLSTHPKEEILKFRNMGENTMPELDSICEKYGIQIRSLSSIKEAFDGFVI